MVYLDTGCLVKLYYPEQDSALIAAKVAGQPLAYTPLHELELSSALQLKVFRREATREQAQAALQLVAEDLAAGKLIALDMVNNSTLHAASDLANQHAAETGKSCTRHLALRAGPGARCRGLHLNRQPPTIHGALDRPPGC